MGHAFVSIIISVYFSLWHRALANYHSKHKIKNIFSFIFFLPLAFLLNKYSRKNENNHISEE